MADWQEVYTEEADRLEMLPVPGGFLYRNWVRAGINSAVSQVALCFVPALDPPVVPAAASAS